MKKLSIIIPCYNEEKTVSTALDMVLNAPLSVKKEIVIVNDGSTDNSADEIRNWIELHRKDCEIKYFEKENGGVSTARNKGLELAQGKYILFLDSDDSLSNNTLQDVFDFFEAHQDEVDLVTYTIQYLNENGRVSSHKRFDILDHTGVYDIHCNYNLLQTTMNVCVKNVPAEERIYFEVK